MLLYCLDNSDAACRSEDYPCGNRLAWQLAVVRTVSRSLLAPQQSHALDTSNNDLPQLAVVSSAGRPELSIAPTSDAAALLGLDVSRLDGERCQFIRGLRLALLAVKRSPTGRVLAFLASQADLPADQCRQLSRNFADARVSLDVVLLCPNDELPPELEASLQLLTAVSVYEPLCASASSGGGSRTATAPPRPVTRGPSPGSEPIGAGVTSRTPATALQPPSSAAILEGARQGSVAEISPVSPCRSAAVGTPSSAGADSDVAAAGPPCGQRLLVFPPPDPSLALWQQLEPLLEQLQLERQQLPCQQAHGESEPGLVGAAGRAEVQRVVPAHIRTGTGLPPLPRLQLPRPQLPRPQLPSPPRHRAGSATAASATTTSSSSSSAAATASSLSPSLSSAQGHRGQGLAPSGPLTSRSGARGGGAGTCRYESLDSLQHLSLDGFLRPWLPSYANFSRLVQSPATTGSGTAQQQQQGGGGSGSSRTTSDSADGGLGLGRLCYISVYRMQLPQWHKMCEVFAGSMYEAEVQLADADSTASNRAVPGASKEGPTAVSEDAAGPSTAVPPSVRPAVVVSRAPCPVQINFSSRCSSAAAAAAATAASSLPWTDSGGASTSAARCHRVYPDHRPGTLSLIASVEDPRIVKLLWSERHKPTAQQQPQYGSIFVAPDDAAEGGVDPAAAELELTLSPTRSQFRVVSHVKGGAVLEVLSPRSAVHRPRQGGSGVSSASPEGQAGVSTNPSTSSSTSTTHLHHRYLPNQHRYFFWLQQDWSLETAQVVDSEASVPAAGHAPMQAAVQSAAAAKAHERDPVADVFSGSERAVVTGGAAVDTAAAGASARLPDRGCRALAEHLQALLECPPEFNARKQGCRVRCSSTPLQLGPLPFALVEEILRASGRVLHPDGTLTAIASALSSTNASAASCLSSHQQQHHQQQLQRQPTGGSATSAGAVESATGSEEKGGRGGGSSQTRRAATAAVATAILQRMQSGTRQPSDDGLCSLALCRLPIGTAGLRPPAAAAVSKCPAGAGIPTNNAAVGDTADASATAASVGSHSFSRGNAQGFSRTTYSRASSSRQAAAATTAGTGLLEQEHQNAARALSSHPLDDMDDWDSDWDSPVTAGGRLSSGVSSPTRSPRASQSTFSDEDEHSISHNSEVSDEDAVGASVEGAFPVGSPTRAAAAVKEQQALPPPAAATCLPSGCTRGGLAAAAAVAAAVGSSGASLVAGVEPEAGGSCNEDASLMFELD